MSYKTDPIPRPRAEFHCDAAGSILSIRIRGEIDHHTASAIRGGIDTILFEKRPKKLILDLSAVSFMDSSGLGLIMGRFSVMRELEGEMTVWDPSPETGAILRLAGMERLVRIEYPPGQAPADGATREGSGKIARRPTAATGKSTAPQARTSPRQRKKNGLACETAPRKEKNA